MTLRTTPNFSITKIQLATGFHPDANPTDNYAQEDAARNYLPNIKRCWQAVLTNFGGQHDRRPYVGRLALSPTRVIAKGRLEGFAR